MWETTFPNFKCSMYSKAETSLVFLIPCLVGVTFTQHIDLLFLLVENERLLVRFNLMSR